MAIPLDYRLAAVLTMISIVAYNIALKSFFLRGYDWRAFIPFVAAGVLLAFAYFAYSYKEISFGGSTVMLTMIILGALALTTAFGWYSMANGSVSVYVAVLAISTPLTALLAAYFLPNETLTTNQWAGVFLGLISLVLVTGVYK
ncbi:MAG: EamA family transporter [Candidatus Burarchaeum sp.]|nr:EamA family transporter [Candidatus Burarchaeum sp.]MDO8339627.1 EamA family transporter [Candidatus Burarchaeum sp.]